MARTRRRRARDGPEPIDLDRIIAAALRLLDERGLDGLSMRNLAERLEIQAGTLYWYIEGKQELLGLLAEAICGEISPPSPGAPWRQRLEELMQEYRRVLLAHRDAAQVLAATVPAGAHRLQLVEVTLGATLDAGFRGTDAVRAGRLLVDYTTGFVQDEYANAARASETRSESAPSDARPRLLPTVGDARTDEFPSMASLAPHLAADNGDARFRFGLSVILDGLEQRRQALASFGAGGVDLGLA